MVRFALVHPMLKMSGFELNVNEVVFVLFVLSFILMAAGGYVINDYYDVKIDELNKPDKLIIGRIITHAVALKIYWLLSITGFLLGCFISFYSHVSWLSSVFLFYFIGLWYYSYKLKYKFLVGNLIVAFSIALVPLAAGIIEDYPLLLSRNDNASFILYWLLGTSFFAFLSTLIREIVKDIEDMQGDASAGCRTVPIVMGEKGAKMVVQLLLGIMFVLFCIMEYLNMRDAIWLLATYLTVFILVPIVIIMIMMARATLSKHYHRVGNWLKLLMVSGICFLFVVGLFLTVMNDFFEMLFPKK
jgi:4-hydroxybenzoate polyprenyltransferase